MFESAQWVMLDSVPSTNTYAQTLVAEKMLPEGSVIIANFQEQGRGQRGNSWESRTGENLLMSTVLYPSFLPAARLFYISKVVALGVYSLVKGLGAEKVSIKWPNDIYIADRKVAGILIENTFRSTEIALSVVGTGININQTEFNEAQKATSLKLECGRVFELKATAEELLRHLAFWYEHLRKNQFAAIDVAYHEKIYRLKMPSVYRENNLMFSGTITGVNEGGKLLIEKETGETIAYDLKEVEFL